MGEGLMHGLPLGYAPENTPYVERTRRLESLLRQVLEAFRSMALDFDLAQVGDTSAWIDNAQETAQRTEAAIRALLTEEGQP